MDDSPVRWLSYVRGRSTRANARASERRVAWLAGLLLAGAAGTTLSGCGCECGSPPPPVANDSEPPASDAGTDASEIMGGGDASGSDGGSSGGPVCGDSVVDEPEQCDDGNSSNDDQCLDDCTLACGDGMLSPVEECDVGIPAGSPGACPSLCDDGDACTTDSIEGAGCAAICTSRPTTTWNKGTIIGGFVDGDGCCAMGANANLDSDCTPTCGNGALELGETCEPASACPTSCDDGNACTVDSMVGSLATCSTSCSATPIGACADGDGCCPTGCCNGVGCAAPDSDCSSTCGDGVLDPLESCDPPSICPTSCDDGDPCTTDQPTGSATTCSAGCSHVAVTSPMAGDACCPAGADANGDPDCPSICGNGTIEPGEDCDDGNSASGDGCDGGCNGEVTVFRLTDLDVRDPHTYAAIPLIGCSDVTDMVPFGLALAVNQSLYESIIDDWDFDGYLDVSVLLMFTPLDQTGAGGAMDVARGYCTAPLSSTTCSLNPTPPPEPTLYTNGSGTCLAPIPGTTTALAGGYTPAITNATGPCFTTGGVSILLDIEGTTVPLQDGQVAATYVGSPAGTMVNGIIRGFISQADAAAILLPAEIPFVGGMPLTVVLPGGAGNCAAHDDRDVGLDGLTLGWWIYGNFTAAQVTYTGT